ncbi:MAG TPA: right-handed parallel beta-helix repeat-containing protein [Kofleriaceae bacterium]|nr:right-handed parallel beta-helix repeat-containing protein [Kofleriaceae bacterium]
MGFDSAAPGDAGSMGEPTDLIVSVTEDRMAGPPTMSSLAELPAGTPGLSLREALAIANNRTGPDRITFDPSVFRAGATGAAGAPIAIDTALEVGDTGTTIEAAGVPVTLMGKAGYAGTLLRVTGAAAVIDGLTLRGGGTAIEAAAVAGLVIHGFTIDDTSSDAIRIDGCAQVTITDGRIERAAGDPLLLRTTTDASVERNFISLLTKSGSVHGINLESVSRSHLIDNIIDPGEAFLINLTDSSDNEVIGNTLDRGDTGLTIFGNSQRNLVCRNVVISPLADSVYIDSPASDNTIVNNTFYLAPDITDAGMNTSAANNLVSSEATDFVDPASYDFHLTAGVPAIDAATDLGLDMLPGQPARFLGQAPDLGAVESF